MLIQYSHALIAKLNYSRQRTTRFGMLFDKFVWNGTTVTIELSRQNTFAAKFTAIIICVNSAK
ncbi:Uncharacterized protein DBV15_11340 [Temnothorax longispinosus]|uniref:Uncharacterized protein n=1 Tax=Temnothorax longispinosus TaxID=300112 RepID=A0A4S2KNA3_9HYME|nr:Uncharacterized protein DBV15_11340 [Temnothorax longispinosus]